MRQDYEENYNKSVGNYPGKMSKLKNSVQHIVKNTTNKVQNNFLWERSRACLEELPILLMLVILDSVFDPSVNLL